MDRLTNSAHFLPLRNGYKAESLARLYVKEIVRLHEVPVTIVSDRDFKFVARFWRGLHEAMGTKLNFSTAFHPQTDGQTERTNQTLEDMLRSCVMDFGGSWDEHLHLVEFSYNNSYHSSIGVAPFEALYGRKCRSPLCWDEVGERQLLGPELVQQTVEKIHVIRDRMKAAQSRQKSYADKGRRNVEFKEGEKVYLRVSPTKGVYRFGIRGKLSPRFIGPFEILEKVGKVSYRLALPPVLSGVHNVFHVSMLKKFVPPEEQIVELKPVQLKPDFSYERPFLFYGVYSLLSVLLS